MNLHILEKAAVRSLRFAVGCRADQVVWDINALYVVGPDHTTKIEAVVATPESPDPQPYDEVFPIRVDVFPSSLTFLREGEPGMAYRVVAEQEVVTRIELVRVAVVFPDEVVEAPSAVKTETFGVNILDCGVIVHTRLGVLLAFQRHPAFGFEFPAPHGWVPDCTARSMVPKEYEIISLEEAT